MGNIPVLPYRLPSRPDPYYAASNKPRTGRTSSTTAVEPQAAPNIWKNPLKRLFHERKAVTYALHIRTFAAQDKNKNGKIEPWLGENGTFLKAIPLLSELKALGVNNIHLLPITPVGLIDRLGEYGAPGSVYSPAAYDRLNNEYDEPGNQLTVIQEARMFVDAAHRLGISVMADIPSCASLDLAKARPDLLQRDAQGNALTPTNWVDIRMLVKDSPALRAYFQKYFDLMIDQVGVDGFRADIARARSLNFWRYFTAKYPDKAWLAESYIEEDASPMKNLPRDIPEQLLKAGFDAFYGQFHIFYNMDGPQYVRYLQQNEAVFQRVGQSKSAIGSFVTHDDPSGMEQGGPLYCKLISGLMMVQPDTNPYILDGFTTGYSEHFNIFDWRARPQGRYPEIGRFLQKMLKIRQSAQYGDILAQGEFTPLVVLQNQFDAKIIAFLRRHQGRTLLVVANKDVNARHSGVIEIPGLNPRQKLFNIAPGYGGQSTFTVQEGLLDVNLGPGKFYLFEIRLPQQ